MDVSGEGERLAVAPDRSPSPPVHSAAAAAAAATGGQREVLSVLGTSTSAKAASAPKMKVIDLAEEDENEEEKADIEMTAVTASRKLHTETLHAQCGARHNLHHVNPFV